MITKDQLFEECRFVRDVAKEIYDDPSNGFGYLRIGKFPMGWCGYLSNVLCVWLGQRFPGEDFFYVCGKTGRQTHAWVKYKSLIIDITADQFDDCSDEIVIVESSKSPLHKRFKVEDKPVIKGISDVKYQPDSYIYQMLFSRKTQNN